MPIRRQHRYFYPIDWRELSNVIRFGRAKGCCERCGRPHGRTVAHLGDGRWWDTDRDAWRSGRGRVLRSLAPPSSETPVQLTKVSLSTAHLDHDLGNNASRNLKALCQRCHMLHNKLEHVRQRRITYRKKRALGDLFLGRYV